MTVDSITAKVALGTPWWFTLLITPLSSPY